MKVLNISASDAKYGGNIYESRVSDALKEDFSVDNFFSLSLIPKKMRVLFFPFFYLLNFIKSNFTKHDVIINSLESISLLSKNKINIVVVHHIDSSFSSLLSEFNQKFTKYLLKINKDRIDKIVVVSKFWQEYLEQQGFSNVEVIYNEISPDLSSNVGDVCELDIDNTKLNVYIGNYHIKKGVYDLVHAFDGVEGIVLHTSGYSSVNDVGLNIMNHERLEYSAYLSLLAKVDLCVTYSKFREGWCRTAHESLLLGTPVIGSGFGGMGELLNNSNMPIVNRAQEVVDMCDNHTIKKLKDRINHDYITDFSYERFRSSWINLIRGYV